jgi:hypothetical protein
MNPTRRLTTISMLAVTILAGLAINAAPAPAAQNTDPPCEWASGQQGTHSACDGKLPTFSEGPYREICWVGASTELVDVAEIWAGQRHLADVRLLYDRGPRTSSHPNGACRTIYAFLLVYNDSASCYAKIERNSDRQAFYTYQWNGVTSPVVYDADVSSYAWGTCQYDSNGNGTTETYSAGTRSH